MGCSPKLQRAALPRYHLYLMVTRPAAWLLLASTLALAACGERAARWEDVNTRRVRLPDGFEIRAEVVTHPQDMMRGMMFRESLPEGRGMLFIHGEPGKYPYWMYQVRIPLDIIWLDAEGRIVEISANTPPCTGKASECPTYGGNFDALMVLEVPAGTVERHKLQVGQRLQL